MYFLTTGRTGKVLVSASPNSDSLRVGKVSMHRAFLENAERQMNNPLLSEGKYKAHKR